MTLPGDARTCYTDVPFDFPPDSDGVASNRCLNWNICEELALHLATECAQVQADDMSLANVRAAIVAVLEQDGTFTIEDSNDQVVRRIETSAEFEGFMQEVDMQRKQFQQDQAQ
uniref:Uncharacterized protein n=1 Tax=Tanacetum cinerariifolium TaxID=118510 RepID=A0A699TVX2_TANCI|nr:hypothetical protein [Tanacetum cinerariifolium]